MPFGPGLAFRLAYIVIILFATMAEPGTTSATGMTARLERALATDVTGRDIVDGIRNLLLFAGWGAVWMVTSAPGPAKPMLLRATLSGLLLSGTVETVQLFAARRVASVLDVATNTVGSFAGAITVAILILVARAGLGRRSYLGMPGLLFALCYGMATFLEAFSPFFRQARLPGVWGSPGERLGAAFDRFEWSSITAVPLLDVLLFVPAGVLGVAALVEMGVSRRRATAGVISGAIVLYAGAELARGAAGYAIALGPLLAHVAGVTVGAWVAVRGLSAFSRGLRGRARPAAVLIAYGIVVAFWVLRPFMPEIDVQTIADKLIVRRFIPLMAYRERMDVFTAADVMIPTLLVMPVGALLAVWPLRLGGWLSGALPAVYAMVILELGQIVVSGRFFDATDILVASASAVLGWTVMRRAGYRTHGEVLPRPRMARASPAGRRQTT